MTAQQHNERHIKHYREALKLLFSVDPKAHTKEGVHAHHCEACHTTWAHAPYQYQTIDDFNNNLDKDHTCPNPQCRSTLRSNYVPDLGKFDSANDEVFIPDLLQ